MSLFVLVACSDGHAKISDANEAIFSVGNVNITKGDDIQLKDLFEIVKRVVGFEGEIVYDKTKPNGTPRKMMDATHIKELGWQPKIDLEQGITDFYNWYISE